MEANILIKILDDIDNKLRNQTYKEKSQVIGALSGMIIYLPDRTIYRYSADELSTMLDRKNDIVFSLHKQGLIDDDGIKEFLLSEDPTFTPKLNLGYLPKDV